MRTFGFSDDTRDGIVKIEEWRSDAPLLQPSVPIPSDATEEMPRNPPTVFAEQKAEAEQSRLSHEPSEAPSSDEITTKSIVVDYIE